MSQMIKDFMLTLKETLPGVSVKPMFGKGEALPVAVISRNGMRDLFYANSFGMRSTQFTVTLYSKSYDELQSLKALVVDQFHWFTGLMGSSLVSRMAVTNILDGFDFSLEELHRSTIPIHLQD